MKSLVLLLLVGSISFSFGLKLNDNESKSDDIFNDHGYLVFPFLKGCRALSLEHLNQSVKTTKIEDFDLNSNDAYVSGILIVEHIGNQEEVLQSISEHFKDCWRKKSFDAQNLEFALTVLGNEFAESQNSKVALIYRENGNFKVYFE